MLQPLQRQILETVSLLSATTGSIEICVLPAVDRPNWIVPANSILDSISIQDKIWTYLWYGREGELNRPNEIAVHRLVADDLTANRILIVEGATDVHRVAIHIQGEPKYYQANISDIKDVDDKIDGDYIYQPVLFQDELHVIPDLDKLSHYLVDLD